MENIIRNFETCRKKFSINYLTHCLENKVKKAQHNQTDNEKVMTYSLSHNILILILFLGRFAQSINSNLPKICVTYTITNTNQLTNSVNLVINDFYQLEFTPKIGRSSETVCKDQSNLYLNTKWFNNEVNANVIQDDLEIWNFSTLEIYLIGCEGSRKIDLSISEQTDQDLSWQYPNNACPSKISYCKMVSELESNIQPVRNTMSSKILSNIDGYVFNMKFTYNGPAFGAHQNIIHFGDRDSVRQPALWFNPNSLNLYYVMNSKGNTNWPAFWSYGDILEITGISFYDKNNIKHAVFLNGEFQYLIGPLAEMDSVFGQNCT